MAESLVGASRRPRLPRRRLTIPAVNRGDPSGPPCGGCTSRTQSPSILPRIPGAHLGRACGSKEAGLLQSGGRGTVHPPAAYRSRRPTPRRTAFQPTPPNLLPARALRAASQFHPWRAQSRRAVTAPGPTGGTPPDVRYTAEVTGERLRLGRTQGEAAAPRHAVDWDRFGDAGRHPSAPQHHPSSAKWPPAPCAADDGRRPTGARDTPALRIHTGARPRPPTNPTFLPRP